MVGMGKGAESGALFKSAEALEMGGRIDTIVFDKTGTITEGNPQVTDIESIHYLDERELLRICASLEKYSEHPISGAIIKKAEEEKLELYPVNEFTGVPGKGISGKIKGEFYKVGNKAFISESIDLCPEVAAAQAKAAGHSTAEELLLLTTHGILHLLGYDHAEPEEEKEMFGLQRRLLLTFLAER